MELFIDIETVPCQAQGIREDLAAGIKPPGTLKKAESIQEWIDNEKPKAIEDAWLKTSFDGGLGQIVCIGFAFDEEPVQTLVVKDLSALEEQRILGEFVDEVNARHTGTAGMKPVIVGHNVAAFDLPFMFKRMVVRNVRPAFWWPRNPKPWSETVFDTMSNWDGKTNVSMDKLCRILGLPTKSASGADVWPMASEGRFGEIAEYCSHDVHLTREIHRRITFRT